MYQIEFWRKYVDDNDANCTQEFSKFIRDLTISLKCHSVLEVGCSTGNDLRSFPENFEVHGLDLNDYALQKAKENLPNFKFQKGSITHLPYDDSSIDLVFTHNVLNYLDDVDLEKAIDELYRVAGKYVVNCELFGEDERVIDESGFRFRNVYKRWLDYKVKIVSNVDMHEEIDPKKSRFSLIRKL